MDIHIKQATLEDLDELIQWRMEVLAEVFDDWEEENRSDLYEANLDYYRHAIPSGEHVAVFAQNGEETVGCGGVCIYREMPSPDNPSGFCAYLMNIYVRREYRGMGIAGRVVRYLIEQAKSRGINKIYLETTESGRILYENLGFTDMKGYMKL